MSLLVSIPSPSDADVAVGPLQVHAYGVILLLGILAATWLTKVRWRAHGRDPELVYRVALWGVLGGIAGARLYHVVTSWNEVPDEWWGVLAVWEGGLGIWGGIAGGVLAGAIVVRRAGESVFSFMDAVAPGLLLAQAIGRWGNYVNQELFGEPTNLPWALEIDPAHRPEGFESFETFHPVFLYESLWSLLGVAVLLLVDRRTRLRPPALFALYVAWYTALRTFLETLRIDPAQELAGLRLNFYVSLVVFATAVAAFVWAQVRPMDGPPRGTPPRRRGRMAVPKSNRR